MRVTFPHSWTWLRRRAVAVGLRVVAVATSAGEKVVELRAKKQELEDEAKVIVDRGEELAKEGKPLAKADDARFEAIMAEETGELAQVTAQLDKAEERVRQIKALAKARDEQNEYDPFGRELDTNADTPSTDRPTFRCEATGRTITGLTKDDSLFKAGNSAGDTFGPRESRQFSSRQDAIHAFAHGLRGVLTGDTTAVRGAFVGGDDRGGFLVPGEISAAITDLARSATVAVRAGAVTLPMDTAELSIVQIARDPQATWRPERVRVPSSDIGFSRVNLRGRMLAAIVVLTLELIEDASANMVDVITRTVAASMAAAIDKAILSGTGTGAEPQGIRSHPAVNTTDPIGTPASYAPATDAVRQILAANYAGEPSGLAWVGNPRDWATIDGLVDTTNQPLRPTPWAEALQKYSTTSLPTDLGDNDNESEMIVGDFSQVVLGVRSPLQMRILDSGTVTDAEGGTINAAEQLAKIVVIHQRVDVALIRPSWFTVVKGVQAA